MDSVIANNKTNCEDVENNHEKSANKSVEKKSNMNKRFSELSEFDSNKN
jgi:hypothetical protein